MVPVLRPWARARARYPLRLVCDSNGPFRRMDEAAHREVLGELPGKRAPRRWQKGMEAEADEEGSSWSYM